MDEKLAHQGAEDAAIAIQGSLILSQALGKKCDKQRLIAQGSGFYELRVEF